MTYSNVYYIMLPIKYFFSRRQKMRAYNPPASKREGGLFSQKYRATLLFLTNKLQEDIAREVGVSYGLIRKWRTEDKFWQTINEHYKEFLRGVALELEKGAVERFSDLGSYNEILIENLDLFTSPELYPKTPEQFVEKSYFVAKETLSNAMCEYLAADSFEKEKRRVRNTIISQMFASLMKDIINLNIKDEMKKEMRGKLCSIIDLVIGKEDIEADRKRLKELSELLGL